MLDFTRKLRPWSALRYGTWRMRRRAAPITLRLRSGQRFELRPNVRRHLGNTDSGVAYEIFVLEPYRDQSDRAREEVRLIVDLGVNVGFSLLYFLHNYPRSRIIGFEPHPGHFAQAIRNLTLDGSRDRVELHPQAVGAFARSLWLNDEGTSSSLTNENSSETIAVEVADVFPLLEGKPIDLLKMDIEGGEHEILGDNRFKRLNIAALVMEWHARADGSGGREWCLGRLHELGYAVEEIEARRNVGMLWARRA